MTVGLGASALGSFRRRSNPANWKESNFTCQEGFRPARQHIEKVRTANDSERWGMRLLSLRALAEHSATADVMPAGSPEWRWDNRNGQGEARDDSN